MREPYRAIIESRTVPDGDRSDPSRGTSPADRRARLHGLPRTNAVVPIAANAVVGAAISIALDVGGAATEIVAGAIAIFNVAANLVATAVI